MLRRWLFSKVHEFGMRIFFTPLQSVLVLALSLAALSTPTNAQQVASEGMWVLSTETPDMLLPPTHDASASSVMQRLMGGSIVDSRVLRGRPSHASTSDAVLQIDPQSNLALLCTQGFGIAGALGSVGQRCLLGQLESRNSLPGYGQGVGIGGAWLSENQSVDLRFGLSWLDNLEHPDTPKGSAAQQLFQSSLRDSVTPFSWDSLQIQGTTLQIGSVVELGERGWFSVQGAQSWLATRNDTFLQLPQRMSVEVLQLDIGMGRLSAGVRGTQLHSNAGVGRVQTIDIGVTWRTPWQGELSVGASQFWSHGDVGQWPLRELPDADETSGRVPYVRYHQDL